MLERTAKFEGYADLSGGFEYCHDGEIPQAIEGLVLGLLNSWNIQTSSNSVGIADLVVARGTVTDCLFRCARRVLVRRRTLPTLRKLLY